MGILFFGMRVGLRVGIGAVGTVVTSPDFFCLARSRADIGTALRIAQSHNRAGAADRKPLGEPAK